MEFEIRVQKSHSTLVHARSLARICGSVIVDVEFQEATPRHLSPHTYRIYSATRATLLAIHTLAFKSRRRSGMDNLRVGKGLGDLSRRA